jgi:hypothetical protein
MAQLLPFRAGELHGSPLAFRCSQGLPEYLSEESEEDDIMIAPKSY